MGGQRKRMSPSVQTAAGCLIGQGQLERQLERELERRLERQLTLLEMKKSVKKKTDKLACFTGKA